MNWDVFFTIILFVSAVTLWYALFIFSMAIAEVISKRCYWYAQDMEGTAACIVAVVYIIITTATVLGLTLK